LKVDLVVIDYLAALLFGLSPIGAHQFDLRGRAAHHQLGDYQLTDFIEIVRRCSYCHGLSLLTFGPMPSKRADYIIVV
jgi:hypothetical protein